MSSKLKVALLSIFFTTQAVQAGGLDNAWTNNTGNGLWKTAGNWSWNFVPEGDASYQDKAKINILPGPLIDSTTAAQAGFVSVSDSTPGGLHMTGGTLSVGWSTTDSWFILGYNSGNSGTFTMDGGAVTTTNRMYVGYQGSGTLLMNGGTINVGGTFGIGYCDLAGARGNGYASITGGTITASSFQMAYPAGATGRLDISGTGSLRINGDVRTAINNYVLSGCITAYNGLGDVIVTLDSGTGRTVLTGVTDPTKARGATPLNNAVNVVPSITLKWTQSAASALNNVYLGTDANAVLNATTATAGIFKGSQPRDANSFYPGALQYDTTYYWRVDEVNGASVVKGTVWAFSTQLDQWAAKSPKPLDTYANVALHPALSWTGDSTAASHDVYFGTDESAVANDARLPGDIDGSGQVDYKDILILANSWLSNPAGSFSFMGLSNNTVINFDDFAILAENWQAQSASTFKGNQTATTFDPGILQPNTIYYWRVDEVNGPSFHKGSVWCFKTTGDTYSMVGKIMAGYQGWFNTPTDGAGRGWVHWGRGDFTPQIVSPMAVPNITVDYWPDMTEYDPDEKYEATNFYDGTNHFYVYSAYNRKTVMRHFKWMQDYGLDGVFLQRFVTEINNDAGYNHFTTVLTNASDAANLYGRKYAIMYDMSGMAAGGTGAQQLIADWKKLVDNLRLTRNLNDTSYICHNGKPVVAIWGVGWSVSSYDGSHPMPADCLTVVNFLKDDPNYGGNTIMLGVKDNWLSSYNSDPTFQSVINKADIISPWTVSGYKKTSEVVSYASSKWGPDITWCNANSKNYLPVVWPGYSRRNLDSVNANLVKTGLNKISRVGGQFLWDQYYYAKNSGATMLYQAMFDEVDEGTAIYKITNSPPNLTYPGGTAMFWSYEGKPSDEYLWLVGQCARMLRGEISLTPTRPARP